METMRSYKTGKISMGGLPKYRGGRWNQTKSVGPIDVMYSVVRNDLHIFDVSDERDSASGRSNRITSHTSCDTGVTMDYDVYK